jgi:hypothetical protein
MRSTGNCYDNAAAATCLAAVKLEAISKGVFVSQRAAGAALCNYLEVFSNPRRLLSAINYVRSGSRAA